ncbi:MAG: UDP-N-acetylglucosamine 2-epimerase (hydrolyzing) [Elusimicrobia bacterium]|nr:UDP-N-acetylglucosamine 2-epimerase (hydrolyzing) [Elusimicrobiota bacterium]
MKRRVIAVYTGNRAEYGLQYPILRAIAADKRLAYKLLVSGAHLQQAFGRTKAEIAKDGFDVHAEVKIAMGDDSLFGTAQAIGSGILSLSRVLARLKPDILVVYADRFEGFSAVITGTQMNIPTAHVEGGDITEGGALDDSVRHAMTKLAHLHFTTNEEAAERVRKLGEEPWRVHNVGFPAVDLVRAGLLASPEELLQRFGVDVGKPLVVFTQHSVTTEYDEAGAQVRPALKAMERLAREGVQILLTYPNNDAGGRRIIAELEKLRRRNVPNLQVHASLGRYNYHGALALPRAVCVGNSSSGIKETPALGCPFVNVGSRQNGRLRGGNVLDVGYDEEKIYEACRKALFDETFRRLCRGGGNPYGIGDAGPKIAQVLATVPLDKRLLQKKMTY